MAGFFDDTENTTSPVVKSFFDDTENMEVNPERTVGSTLKDLAISTGRGALGIPGMITGLADLPIALSTGTRPFETATNYIGEKTGFQPGKLADKLAEDYSPVQKQSEAEVNKVWDDSNTNAADVAKAYLTNPGYTVNKVVEALPSMAVGGVASKAIMGVGKVATAALPAVEGIVAKQAAQSGAGLIERKLAERAIAKLGPNATPEAIAAAEQAAYRTTAAIAGGAGEGLVTAGQTMDQAKGDNERKNAIAALGAGAVTAAIGFGAGKVAQHFGLETAETAMAKSFNDRVETEIKTGISKYGKAGAVAAGALSEGILQELPQSAQEQVWSNYANDKPLWEGVNRAAVEGALAGFAMGGGANLISGQNKNNKSLEEIALDRRAENILNLDKDKLNEGIQKLSKDLKTNQELLSDVNKLEAKAAELKIDPKELISKIVYDNKSNQTLLDKVNAGIKAKEELTKKEYEKLSPEEKAIKDVEAKLIASKEADKQKVITEAQKINERLGAIDKIETIFSKLYSKEVDPEKKKQMADRVFSLRKEKNTLLDQKKEVVENKTFAPYTTREERQKYLEDVFGTINVGEKVGIEKDATESAAVFQEELSSKNIADYVNQINNVKAEDRQQAIAQLMDKVAQEKNVQKIAEYTDYIKNNIGKIRWNEYTESKQRQDLQKPSIQQMMDAIVKESDPAVRQKLYNQMFEQPGIKDAQESAAVFEGNAAELDHIESDRSRAEAEKAYTDLFAQEKRPFNIDAYNEATTKSAADSATAFEKAGMGKGQASSFTDERQVPLTDNQQILVDKNNFEIAKLTEQWNRSVDRDERIDALNKIAALEKDNAAIRTSVEQFNTFEALEEEVTFVKDSTGNDLVGFHGTSAKPFKAFDDSKIQQFEHGWSGAGHYFTLKKDYAQGYAELNEDGRIVEARFDFKNPLYKNSPEYKQILKDTIGKTSILNKEDGFKATEAFKAAGYDAVIDGKSLDNALEINVFESKNIHYADEQTYFDLEGNQKTSAKQTNQKQETNLGNILSQVKSAESLTGQLGKFLSDFIPESKLNIKVIIDPLAKSASYVGGAVNTITLRDQSQLTSSLHEITHAVTVREMIANSAIRDQVKLLMDRVKLKAIKEAILTPVQVELLNTQSTSRGYKENLIGKIKYSNVAYGLLNEYEFLAQAMGNEQFQKLLKATTIADKGVLRNAWDAFVEVVMKALGIKDINKNAFGEVLSIIAKLAQQENINQFNQTINEELTIEQRLPQSDYDAVYAEKNNRLKDFIQNAGIKYHEVKLLADKAFGSISTRLKNVDPELSEHLRWLDFKTSQKIIDILRTAKPLLEVTKTMSPEDKSEWNWARLNSDEGKIARIENKYGLTEQVKLLREKLDQIREEAIEVGYDVGFIEDYWPRVIKDTQGFLQATQEISQRAEFTEAIRDKAKELGITQKQFERDYPEMKADIISNMILGRYYGIGGPGNIKARVFETIPKEYAKFYMDADASLMQYVYSMTKKIEARRFFGKVPERISALKADRNRKQADLIKFKQLAEMARTENSEAFADYQDRITQINEDLVRIEEPLNAYKHQNDYTENIGAYIDEMRVTGRIAPEHEKTVKDILMARFNEQGTHGAVNTFKNASYIDVMANPASAITQIGDLAWAMYVGKVWTPSGFLGTTRNLAKAITSKSEITKEDLGFERIAQEFADGTTLGKAVSKAFKLVGLEKIDTIGKEVLINNALDQYKAEAKQNPEALAAKIKPTFGNKSLDVVQEILADVPSDNVKMLLYSKVLDFQPAALSEMPEYYLTAGNGRVFYMLKTYSLKQMDVFRREVVHNLKSSDTKNRIQGMTNMVQLLALLTLANAGADELKDWMLGKETRFSDNVIENLLTMGGASRYTQMQISKEGFGSAMLQQILPPMKFINSASKDLNESYKNYVSGDTSSFDHARIVDSIPLAGKLYYWHYGRGEENKKSLAEKDFSEATKDADLFKKQLENSQDKKLFIESNLDRFKQMKLQENFQAALNRNKAVINKLEKLPSTENVQTRLGQLKSQREQILKKYIEVAKTIQ